MTFHTGLFYNHGFHCGLRAGECQALNWADLNKEGSEVVTKCNRLKLIAKEEKKYVTETLLRLVQSVPSPKAEPIKLRLAKAGHERFQEMADSEIALNRSRDIWKKHGRPSKWIEQRVLGQETRNKLTDYPRTRKPRWPEKPK